MVRAMSMTLFYRVLRLTTLSRIAQQASELPHGATPNGDFERQYLTLGVSSSRPGLLLRCQCTKLARGFADYLIPPVKPLLTK
jgi:hypothetical protein